MFNGKEEWERKYIGYQPILSNVLSLASELVIFLSITSLFIESMSEKHDIDTFFRYNKKVRSIDFYYLK